MMEDKLIEKLAEYGLTEDLNRPSYFEYIDKKSKEWIDNGQTLFGEDAEGHTIEIIPRPQNKKKR